MHSELNRYLEGVCAICYTQWLGDREREETEGAREKPPHQTSDSYFLSNEHTFRLCDSQGSTDCLLHLNRMLDCYILNTLSGSDA